MRNLEVELLPCGEASGEVRYVKSRAICSYAIRRAEQRRAYGPTADGAAGGVFKSRRVNAKQSYTGMAQAARTASLVGQQKTTDKSSAEQQTARQGVRPVRPGRSRKHKSQNNISVGILLVGGDALRLRANLLTAYTSTDTRERAWAAAMLFLRLASLPLSQARCKAWTGKE